MSEQNTTISIERNFGDNSPKQVYIISEDSAMHNIEDFTEAFVRPMLRVLGYSENTINSCIGGY